MAASTPAVQTGGGTIRKSKWGRSTRRPRASSHGFQSVSEEGNKPPQETSSEPGGLAGTVAGGVTSLVSTLLGAVGAGTTRSQAPDASDVALDESAPPLSVQPPASLQASTRGAPPQKKKPLPAQVRAHGKQHDLDSPCCTCAPSRSQFDTRTRARH